MGNVCDSASASIDLQNDTGRYFKFQVLHAYTNQSTDSSGWIMFAPGERKHVMDIFYYHGWLTTGMDNWQVHGIHLIQVDGRAGIDCSGTGIPQLRGDLCTVDGHVFAESPLHWRTFHGPLADWKVHSLSEADRSTTTLIRVLPSEVRFISNSGVSVTRWLDSTNFATTFI